MPIQIDPVEHSVSGLTGGIHTDYRADIASIQTMGGGLRRINLRLVDDMPKPEGRSRRQTLSASVVAPEGLEDYTNYRVELWRRIERGGPFNDITI